MDKLKSKLKGHRTGHGSVQDVTSWLLAVSSFARDSNSKVKYAVKLGIVLKARYFVCTASSAVKLRKKLEREVLPPAGENTALEAPLGASGSIVSVSNVAGAVSALAERFGKVLHAGIGGLRQREPRKTKQSEVFDAKALHELLNFRHVVLDEAGAMLEPDMV